MRCGLTHISQIRTLCRSSMHTSRASLVELAVSVEADLSGPVGSVAVPSAPVIQPRSQQQQRRGGASFSSGSGRGGLPAQGQKRSRDESSGGSQGTRGSRVISDGVSPVAEDGSGSDSAGSGSAGESDCGGAASGSEWIGTAGLFFSGDRRDQSGRTDHR
ncbi:unnamed protein product [Microthlaspi erraticum]|uniref:Uncharacterized protein n=1 Tax=Microthlaspi erraticum TaxID=1685480 RepID=A0A6D2HWY2_9BRAS|nr:unnamed protein product [Microthlaspi erraticum]